MSSPCMLITVQISDFFWRRKITSKNCFMKETCCMAYICNLFSNVLIFNSSQVQHSNHNMKHIVCWLTVIMRAVFSWQSFIFSLVSITNQNILTSVFPFFKSAISFFKLAYLLSFIHWIVFSFWVYSEW